ncbi:SNF1-related protein kinase regulatory subunit beta-3 [Ziziphus jujuba]|uniref:SNF1-related protein kinase regulatory subunit beta-3 n=1 Tax=Ziziphus jujuba TaxID=326968 RepID=A0ABM3IB64_ZIZJJ|nr:SNF1-related protein kinase regulatory subunit beta-3 [Ziziphus jujuba]
MNNPFGEHNDEATVVGFEVPRSPDSSYNNVYPGNEDEARDPPSVPSHLQHTLLSCPASSDLSATLPLPQNVILNHLYIENRETPRSVVALGLTHRFRSKFVTVVLYKPVQRRGSTST